MKKSNTAIAALVLALMMAIPTIVIAQPLDDIPQRTENGVVYVRLRQAAYAHGADVEWNGATRTVYITDVDGSRHSVAVEEVGGFIEDGTSWIPLEFVATLFNEAATQETVRPQIHGMLTRIVYEDNVAYIFGTMHAGQADWFPLHYIAEEAMARADIFAFEIVEIDGTGEVDDDIEELAITLAVLPDGLTLEDILPEDVFINFITNFETFNVIGLEYEHIANLTPIALMTRLEIIMVELLGADFGISVDSYIANFAETHNRPIIGLNDTRVELGLILDVPLDTQLYALVDFPDFDTMLATFADTDVVEAYATQDRDAILTVLSASSQDNNPFSQHFHHAMWRVRCQIFSNEIARLLQETEEPTVFFVAIGLSHIIGGDFGQVIYLLEDMGFEVTSLWKEVLE